jgi:ABC-type Mn2+/Zn2+ transport system permease subunit
VQAWFRGTDEAQLFLSAVTLGEIQAGIELTRRQDLAKAQAIELWLDQLAATAGALFVSLAIAGITRRWPAQREALIGLLYVAGACLAMLGASAHPHGKEKLMQLLAADVLWVNTASVLALTTGKYMLQWLTELRCVLFWLLLQYMTGRLITWML